MGAPHNHSLDLRAGPRIGLTGSAGVGKTTLALTLAAALGVRVLPEAMRGRLEAGFSLHGLSRAEHRSLLLNDARALADRAVAEGDTGFVADRTPLDFVAFWLCNGYAADEPEGTGRFLERAAADTACWDLVIVLPWGDLPLVEDGIRFANPWHQLHAHTVIEGLCRRYVAPERLLFLPRGLGEPDVRCEWVLRRLRSAGRP